MSDDNHSPKQKTVSTSHIPPWRKPFKFITYVFSATLFQYISTREMEAQPAPTEGAEGNSVLGRFQSWFYLRARVYIAIVVIVCFSPRLYSIYIYLGDMSLQIYGLVLDLVGAIVITRGLFRGYVGVITDMGIVYEEARNPDETAATPSFTQELQSLDSEVRATVDAVFGAIFLVGGFSIQIVSVL